MNTTRRSFATFLICVCSLFSLSIATAQQRDSTTTVYIEVFDPNDTLIKTECATETAKRLE